jgi:hypothetical protein
MKARDYSTGGYEQHPTGVPSFSDILDVSDYEHARQRKENDPPTSA